MRKFAIKRLDGAWVSDDREAVVLEFLTDSDATKVRLSFSADELETTLQNISATMAALVRSAHESTPPGAPEQVRYTSVQAIQVVELFDPHEHVLLTLHTPSKAQHNYAIPSQLVDRVCSELQKAAQMSRTTSGSQ